MSKIPGIQKFLVFVQFAFHFAVHIVLITRNQCVFGLIVVSLIHIRFNAYWYQNEKKNPNYFHNKIRQFQMKTIILFALKKT